MISGETLLTSYFKTNQASCNHIVQSTVLANSVAPTLHATCHYLIFQPQNILVSSNIESFLSDFLRYNRSKFSSVIMMVTQDFPKFKSALHIFHFFRGTPFANSNPYHLYQECYVHCSVTGYDGGMA